jgi:hypothetical protein
MGGATSARAIVRSDLGRIPRHTTGPYAASTSGKRPAPRTDPEALEVDVRYLSIGERDSAKFSHAAHAAYRDPEALEVNVMQRVVSDPTPAGTTDAITLDHRGSGRKQVRLKEAAARRMDGGLWVLFRPRVRVERWNRELSARARQGQSEPHR